MQRCSVLDTSELPNLVIPLSSVKAVLSCFYRKQLHMCTDSFESGCHTFKHIILSCYFIRIISVSILRLVMGSLRGYCLSDTRQSWILRYFVPRLTTEREGRDAPEPLRFPLTIAVYLAMRNMGIHEVPH